MIQVGKLFQRVPYFVRDEACEYNSINIIEELVNEFLSNYMMNSSDLIEVFSNNRDSLSNLHLVIKDGALPNLNLYPEFVHDEFDVSYEEQLETKAKAKKVNSLMLIEELENRKEYDLAKTFEEIIGCDGEELFISIKEDKFDMYNPSSENFDHRCLLEDKKRFILELCNSFDIDSKRLYNTLNPNLIKAVCNDLKITYKTLALQIGYKPDTVNKAASSNKISLQLSKAIQMYLENLRLKEYLKDFELMKATLKKILD